MRRSSFFFLAALVLVADQITKRWVVNSLSFDTSKQLIAGFLYFTRTTNTGAAFGVLPHATVVLAVMAMAAVVGIIIYTVRCGFPLPVLKGIALALPLGGALGNFADRARLGYVVDFIEVRLGSYSWPIFNVADSAICIGVALLVLAALKTQAKTPVQQEKTQPLL
jgi:signal peptidase II